MMASIAPPPSERCSTRNPSHTRRSRSGPARSNSSSTRSRRLRYGISKILFQERPVGLEGVPIAAVEPGRVVIAIGEEQPKYAPQVFRPFHKGFCSLYNGPLFGGCRGGFSIVKQNKGALGPETQCSSVMPDRSSDQVQSDT